MSKMKKKRIYACLLLTAGMLTACGKGTGAAERIQLGEPELVEESAQGNETEDMIGDEAADTASSPLSGNGADIGAKTDTKQDTEEDILKKEKFGENCITEQTFEVELSEYEGKVWFVTLAPTPADPNLHMQIIQEGKVLAEIPAYVPESLAGAAFTSLDAAAFQDINYDDHTDIILLETYGAVSFAALYYGHTDDADAYDAHFIVQEALSEAVTKRLSVLSVLEIRNLLTGGKRNGEFDSYQEAYEAVSNLRELENAGNQYTKQQYDLLYFDEDEIPELAAGVEGYWVSLYTYHEGTVYMLMDDWGYGVGGNTGYAYSPRNNSLRNYDTEYAGAILYTSYMKIGSRYTMDMAAQIVTYNFDDANGNGILDEEETDSVGMYGVSYIDGVEASEEECEAFYEIYDAGEYEYIKVSMDRETLLSVL